MKIKTLTRLIALALLAFSILNPQLSATPLGTAFTYQGQLTASGNPANGGYDLSFALFDAPSDGAQQGATLTNTAVAVSNGLFTVALDFGAGVFTGEVRWLEIAVRTNGGGEFTTLSPRQPLTPSPYALYAPSAGAATTAATATTVAVNGVASASLQPNAVTTDKIADGSVSTSDLSPTVLSNTFWRLVGNGGTTPGAQFLGTTDNQPVEVKANSSRVLRLEPDPVNDAPNVIAGSRSNAVAPGVVGAVIAGGGRSLQPNRVLGAWGVISGGEANVVSNHYDVVSGGLMNTATGGFSTVGGGSDNVAQGGSLGRATVAGGMGNRATDSAAAVGGGRDNAATNQYATVPGGRNNLAGGSDSLAAGRRAKAQHTGAFVWADSTDADFASSGPNQFLIRATGGVGINTPSPRATLDVAGGDALVRGPGDFAPGTDARLSLGDSNSYVRAVWGEGLRLGVFNGPDALAVNNGGNVGVGTNNPQSALHVAGTVTAAGFSGNGAGLTALSGAALSAGSVGQSALAGDSITSAKVADGTITAADVQTNTFWRNTGNSGTTPGTHFLGTTDDRALELKVNSQRALRVEPHAWAPNIIGGYSGNSIGAGSFGNVIAGGGEGFAGQPNTIGPNTSHNAIGGGLSNDITNSGASTIAGGCYNDIGRSADGSAIGGGYGADASTIGGGWGNSIYTYSQFATVAGGYMNWIGTNSPYGAIGGGINNRISPNALCGTIPGGYQNSATNFAFAAGYNAKANHTGAFVWADPRDTDFASTAANQFLIRASGGVGIGTTSPQQALHVVGDAFVGGTNFSAAGHTARLILGDENHTLRSVYGGGLRFGVWPNPDALVVQDDSGNVGIGASSPAYPLHMGGGAYCTGTQWQNFSDRNSKEDFATIEPGDVLDKVAALSITQWKYKSEPPGVKHVGPVAQDFHAAFGLGESERSIGTLDANGVALAAIQGLNVKVEVRSAKSEGRLQQLEAENADLKRRLDNLECLLTQRGDRAQ